MKRLTAFLLVFLCIVGITPSAGAADNYFATKNLEKYTFTLGDAQKIALPFQTRTYKKKDVKAMGSVTARWAKVKFAGGAKASPKLYVPSGSKAVSVTVKDKSIAKKFNNVDGYEWRGIRLNISYRDGNSKKYGTYTWWNMSDYYSGNNYEKGYKTQGSFQYSTFTVEKDGQQYTKCRAICWASDTKSGIRIYFFVRVPVGYEGATIGIPNTVGRGSKYNTSKYTPSKIYSKGGIIFRLSDERKDNDPWEKRENTLTKKEIKTWYKSTCSKIAYKKLARSPGKYEGRKIKFTGYVVQVCKEISGYGFGYNQYRIATKGRYNNVIYVNIPGRLSTRILEGDKVTVWGEFDGLMTYTTVLGASVTIPEMTAEYYSIK